MTAILTWAAPAAASAAVPPHVVESTATVDACAICHRTHTSNVDLGYRTTGSTAATGNALIVAPASDPGTPGFPAPQRGDVGLCYTCHGAPGLGSQFDVETEFSLASTHAIAPYLSAYGPSPKMCSSCHDAHGTAKVAGLPYPRLLRAWADTTTVVYTGDAYCEACHAARPLSTFDGRAVYRSTAHYTALPDPVSGTKARCSICHAAHGSNVAPLIAAQVTPPSVAATVSVTANDRRFCLTCHAAGAATWSGDATYALSAHAASTATAAIPGEWPAAGASRKVGECQACHAAMGRDDGAGSAVAKLLEKPGRALCDTCHKAGGPASTDLKSLAYPASESAALELAVTWGPDARSAYLGRTDAYSRDTTGTAPRALIGPRTFASADATGASATGDIDGDGSAELVVGNAGAGTLTIMHADALRGMQAAAPQAVAGVPDFLAIGRFVQPAIELSGPRPQIAVLDAAAGKVWLYENMVGSALTLIGSGVGDGSYVLGGTGTGMAAGDFTGGALADLAVTTQGADQLLLFTQDGGTPSVFAAPTIVGGIPAPRGPAIGDITGTAAPEVIVCATGDRSVRAFNGAGGAVWSAGPLATSGVPWAAAVGDALPGVAGNEVAVAMRDPAGPATLAVVTGGGVESGFTWGLAPAFSGSVLVGDADGDGRAETVLGSAGQWLAAGMKAPWVDVFRPDAPGTSLAHSATLVSGDSGLAGRAPGLALADLGPVLPSRHPIDEVAVSHVSTETGSFVRHVTCSDCHDSHEASSGVAASAPAVTGDMRGAWGFAVTNTAAGVQTLAGSARAANQYEVCFKCHATSAGGRQDIASLVNTENVSVHAVEATSTAPRALAASYVAPWGNASRLYCSDCHGNSVGTEPRGGHRSADAPILKAPYAGTSAGDPTLLCYRCHDVTTYTTLGASSAQSRFYDAVDYGASASGGALHGYHVAAAPAGLGLTCDACHVSHGSATLPRLIRPGIGFAHETGGAGTNSGTCGTTVCHAASHAYVAP